MGFPLEAGTVQLTFSFVRQKSPMRFLALGVLASVLMACSAPTRSRAWLSDSVHERTRFTLGSDGGLPADVTVDDGLTPDEAVAVALWNNPGLQGELTQLEAALATLDEAKRPANPRLNLLAPIDPRQLALALFVPIESLWQMPSRIEASTAELEAVADALVQQVLDVERLVRLAHVDVTLAARRQEALARAADAWGHAVGLADGRARAGDIAPAEADAVRAEWVLATDAVARAEEDQVMGRARVCALLGAPWPELPALVAMPPPAHALELATLQRRALERRPDLAAAQFAVHAAAARAQWERTRVFSLFVSVDGQAPVGKSVPNWAPGLQAELPLFSQNQGGIGRADAAAVRAVHRYAATRLSVLQDVALAHAAVTRARRSREAARQVSALVATGSAAAERSFADGSESYLVVVDALRRDTDARLREVDLEAEWLRAEAELARAVGGRALLENP